MALTTRIDRSWIGAASDITERREAEQRVKDADRRKDEFLAMLAHELRNPLAPIGAAAELKNFCESVCNLSFSIYPAMAEFKHVDPEALPAKKRSGLPSVRTQDAATSAACLAWAYSKGSCPAEPDPACVERASF
ncbi:hypothetical protein LMG27174_02059 [Paraburkholderia rhynchosiae]|uniref:histidine kinase n=1 Tax=Paraburkholderia rhynchosiae TaxID=487049 RepID=A0A6J5AKK2_9BURK|nr:hypothetical protein LMG27174_02059 [Paraburkholderia rhynchosiae]